ncbi:hypothetical protein [Natrarchaeobius chitinivorans]|uniref:Uncharacterized protein n=1 Tax=Natrarchaeobius chitinivorans TaxID=1679083 RepID=A0A3N6MNL0_NATCH|nr:hypothetical protein [Natrarchaeobius chitinivorans]RQG97711.1 hypothetical protein EA473_00375 [Natrarchaeobius chitinivorans]
MIGAYTIGKKAATIGYKRYGVPGAVASGGVALLGVVAVKRALRSATEADDGSIASAVDAESIEAAVDERGLEAVTDVGTLEDAIDPDQLREGVDLDDVRSSVDDETDEFADEDDGAA